VIALILSPIPFFFLPFLLFLADEFSSPSVSFFSPGSSSTLILGFFFFLSILNGSSSSFLGPSAAFVILSYTSYMTFCLYSASFFSLSNLIASSFFLSSSYTLLIASFFALSSSYFFLSSSAFYAAIASSFAFFAFSMAAFFACASFSCSSRYLASNSGSSRALFYASPNYFYLASCISFIIFSSFSLKL
jgi:hypothetical protein